MTDCLVPLRQMKCPNTADSDARSFSDNQLQRQMETIVLSQTGMSECQIKSLPIQISQQKSHLGGTRAASHPSSSKRQFHFWLWEKDFLFLRDQAQQEGEPIARIIRRLIREFRISAESADARSIKIAGQKKA